MINGSLMRLAQVHGALLKSRVGATSFTEFFTWKRPGGSMSDLQPLPAFLKKDMPIPVRRRPEPSFFVQMFLAVMFASALLAIGAASAAFYWLCYARGLA